MAQGRNLPSLKNAHRVLLGLLLIAGLLMQAGPASGQTPPTGPPAASRLTVEHHLTLAPKPGNSRNSEGDFIQLKDGRWLFIYTHFTDGADDHSKAFLASRESSDGGKTWTDHDRIVVADEGGFNVMSVSLLRLKTGGLALFYLRKNSLQDCRPVMRLSHDEAKTWSGLIECITDGVGYYVLNNSRIKDLRTNVEISNTQKVLDGDLDPFIQASLKMGI